MATVIVVCVLAFVGLAFGNPASPTEATTCLDKTAKEDRIGGRVKTDEIDDGKVSRSPYPRDSAVKVALYEARVGQTMDIPCNHDMEPITIEWKYEYSYGQFFDENLDTFASNQPILHLPSIREVDAGTYVCQVTNVMGGYDTVETKSVLRVNGVVPLLMGTGWIALPTLEIDQSTFDIEISFKPQDPDGLIMYNSQYDSRSSGDYISIYMIEGKPAEGFFLIVDATAARIKTKKSLKLNEWHTIRVRKRYSVVSMMVDNTDSYETETRSRKLNFQGPLYIGGVPNYAELPFFKTITGFAGCISSFKVNGSEMLSSVTIKKHEVYDCDTCNPNQCLNDAVCQEARNERGYRCLCSDGFGGLNCGRYRRPIHYTCRSRVCEPGKCTDTTDGFKCACPVTHIGRLCEYRLYRQSIEYPAFNGNAYIALKLPNASYSLNVFMKVKAIEPVTDGIIMYGAESAGGRGGFTSLAVRNGKLEFRYYRGKDRIPFVLTSNTTLPSYEWTDVQITCLESTVSLVIDFEDKSERLLAERVNFDPDFEIKTPLFIGGVDDDRIIIKDVVGVRSGFKGCIKHVRQHGIPVDIMNSSIYSSNVQGCSSDFNLSYL